MARPPKGFGRFLSLCHKVLKTQEEKAQNMDLSARQQKFVVHYALTGDARHSAHKAGYSEAKAEAAGAALLGCRPVVAAVRQVGRDMAMHDSVTQHWVAARLVDVTERCLQAVPGPGGEYRFDAASATRALNLLGKYLQMFSDRVEHRVSMHESALEELE